MSFSIDDKRYRMEYPVSYGEEFPKAHESREVGIEGFGHCLIYIIAVDRAYWGKDLTVYMPIVFYITQVIYEDGEYSGAAIFGRKKPTLRLIK